MSPAGFKAPARGTCSACLAALLALSASAALAQDATPPRLAGIFVSGDRRAAIFTGPDGQGSVVVREGERIGGFIIAAIRPGEAELTGSAGRYRVVPSANGAVRSQWLVLRPLIDPDTRERFTENDQ